MFTEILGFESYPEPYRKETVPEADVPTYVRPAVPFVYSVPNVVPDGPVEECVVPAVVTVYNLPPIEYCSFK